VDPLVVLAEGRRTAGIKLHIFRRATSKPLVLWRSVHLTCPHLCVHIES